MLPRGIASKIMPRMKLWSWQKENLPSVRRSVRTALAATASVIVARFGTDARSLLGGNRDSGRNAIDSRRYADAVYRTRNRYGPGRVSRSSRGKLFRSTNLAAFMLAIFFIGLLSFGFRLEKTAYRYASVTLAIIVLIPRTNPAWIIALHRFIEVSVGIIVALAVVAFWPERSTIAADE